MHYPRRPSYRALARALAAASLIAAAGIALPAAPAAAAAPPLPPDTSATSTPTMDPLGQFIVSRGLDGSVLYSRGIPFDNNRYLDFVPLCGPIQGDPTGAA